MTSFNHTKQTYMNCGYEKEHFNSW